MEKWYEEMIKEAEKLDWSVDVDVDVDNSSFNFRKYSPAGQDFDTTIKANNLEEAVKQLQQRCENFDCSAETYIWLDNSGHGVTGAPHDMKDLYEDMEACLEMMEELSDEIKKITNN